MERLKNELCSVEFRPDEKEIFARDLTDHYNDPAMYTKTKRNIKRAWDSIQKRFTPETKLFDVIEILREFNIRTHYWCMVD